MKKFFAGILIGLIVGLMVSTCAVALGNTPIKLIVNGNEVQCDVPPQNIGGRVLVPARFVAEALGATVDWDGATQSVIVKGKGYAGPSQPVSPIGTGSIKGTVTYQYNKFIGSRGDVGADVFLISKNTAPGSINYDPKIGLTGKFTTNSPTDLYRIKVDGMGHYEFNNIPAGEYVIVICSKGANAFTGYVAPEFKSLVKPFFDSTYDTFVYGNTFMWKHVVDSVTVLPNSMTDYSHDFGYSM